MFGFRRSITNEECEVVALEGLLEGLNYRLNSLINISNRPDNRSDLTEEIKRVKNEIEIKEIKLKEMRTLVQFQQQQQQINRID
jgi:hypothetical protein